MAVTLRNAIRDEPAFQPSDLVAQHELAFFQTLEMELVRRTLISQPSDHSIEVAVLAPQSVQFS